MDLIERSHTIASELKSENAALSHVNNDLDNFVYSASHDLKSPISNIEGLIEVLSDIVEKEKPDKDAIVQIIKLVKISVHRFATTIKDLTTIVETQKNIDDGKSEEVNILEIVEEVKFDLSNLINASKASLEVVAEDNLKLYFSKRNLKSILYNLISNAVKYRSPLRLPEVLVRFESMHGRIQLSVKDNGLGIPSDKKEEVFSMFKRLHDHVEGSGIGLHIVKRIMDFNKGRIEIDSTIDAGTTFTIVF